MQFITLDQANNINHIVDIRSIPYSKYAPWSDNRLPNMLLPFKIKYTYLGHKLGESQFKRDLLSKGTYRLKPCITRR